MYYVEQGILRDVTLKMDSHHSVWASVYGLFGKRRAPLAKVGIRWQTLANVLFTEDVQHLEHLPTFGNKHW
jgi:hypothetical protein